MIVVDFRKNLWSHYPLVIWKGIIMKSIILLLSLICSTFAGWGYNRIESNIQTDPVENRIYIGINGTRTEGRINKTEKIGYDIIDYLIYEPETKKQKRLLPNNQKEITFLLFEVSYDDSLKMIKFNNNESDYTSQSGNIINNVSIKKRLVRNKILFVINHPTKNKKEFWEATKDGKELKKIYTLSTLDDYDWHLDVQNNVLRFIIKTPNNVKINEVKW